MRAPTTITAEVVARKLIWQSDVSLFAASRTKKKQNLLRVTYYIGLLILIILQPVQFTGSSEAVFPMAQQVHFSKDSHQVWDELLMKYVDSEGNVNYLGFKNNSATLDSYLEQLAYNVPANSASREEKLVYYINLYNAATVKLILENYPLASIKDIVKPWDTKWVKTGEKTISLGHIEHKILRKLGEPRIHFAINCASYSCPKLSNRAYTLNNLEQQLQDASSDFINDPKRNRISEQNAEISEIFKWFKSDFTKEGSLRDYINQYSEAKIAEGTKLKFMNYDWSLNEAK